MEQNLVASDSLQQCQCKKEVKPKFKLMPTTLREIETKDLLLIALGSRGAIEKDLDFAETLHGIRVRVATFNCYRLLVLGSGLEFYDIGSRTQSPEDIHTADEWRSVSLRIMWSFFDEGHAQVKRQATRPFVTDLAVANQASSSSIRRIGHAGAPLLFLEQPLVSGAKDVEEARLWSLQIKQTLGIEEEIRCVVFEALPAYWRYTESGRNLSGAAAAALLASETIRWSELELLSPRQYMHHGEVEGLPATICRFWRLFYAFLLLVRQVLFSNVRILGQEQFTEENNRCLRMRDPFRRARMKQGCFDLEMIKERANVDVGGYVLQMWDKI